MQNSYKDTRPEVLDLQNKLLRQDSPARKLKLLGQMNLMVKSLAISGLQFRYPDKNPETQRRCLAELMLGKEIAEKVYGSLVDEKCHSERADRGHAQSY